MLSALCACGLALGKVRVGGISLGVTFVFFVGILAGNLGLSIDPQMLQYAQDFGLVLFVYALVSGDVPLAFLTLSLLMFLLRPLAENLVGVWLGNVMKGFAMALGMGAVVLAFL